MGKSEFEKLLEKAVQARGGDTDWDSIMTICDCIRQASVRPSVAIEEIKKKINSDNTLDSQNALILLECLMKNCGHAVHDVVATKDFMAFVRDLCKNKPDVIKARTLEMLQAWSHAFRNETNYRIVQDTYDIMKLEGYSFPVLDESDALFATEIAPKWKEDDECYRCENTFGIINRRHHCRNCGESFCGKCSSKKATLPKFFIDQEVRVCERCYDTLKGRAAGASDSASGTSSSDTQKKSETVATKQRSEEEAAKEEEDLQLALALSRSEAEAKSEQRERMKLSYTPNGKPSTSSAIHSNESNHSASTALNNEPMKVTAPTFEVGEGITPELSRYLNRNYWEKKSGDLATNQNNVSASQAGSNTRATSGGKKNQTATPAVSIVTMPSAPEGSIISSVSSVDTRPVTMAAHVTSGNRSHEYQNGGPEGNVYEEIGGEGEEEENPGEEEEFLRAMSGSIDVFVNRMKSDQTRGRSVANDSAVQTLFSTLEAMRPQLVKYVHRQEDKRAHLESLQDKLSQLKDARDALTALREEHAERKRREYEEKERHRQILMARQLDIMRQKKQEYLQYQRQLALQKMEEQRREMDSRLQQQKQMTALRQMQLQSGYNPMLQSGYLPPGVEHLSAAALPGQLPPIGNLPPNAGNPMAAGIQQQPLPLSHHHYGLQQQPGTHTYQAPHGASPYGTVPVSATPTIGEGGAVGEGYVANSIYGGSGQDQQQLQHQMAQLRLGGQQQLPPYQQHPHQQQQIGQQQQPQMGSQLQQPLTQPQMGPPQQQLTQQQMGPPQQQVGPSQQQMGPPQQQMGQPQQQIGQHPPQQIGLQQQQQQQLGQQPQIGPTQMAPAPGQFAGTVDGGGYQQQPGTHYPGVGQQQQQLQQQQLQQQQLQPPPQSDQQLISFD